MSNADTSGSSDPDKTNINVRLTESFLGDIDATWREEGFNSRSEFIRHVLRDAVKHPGLSREAWKDIVATEHQRRTGSPETLTREDVLDRDDDE
ncbi:ribbon-helix-helix domain-containing protein [Halococcoides cellulosivorans]|uniref:CopG family transcriptional regulator n=1 Tax=Halococcoides cellulosivorans TaxID=1679096 RepID=A0A2R4X054_9EURY|nr:ribbon-helix-helix domain-containing protein [Halococcoides cellulosivorans]AWB27141.1 CopG family transcriptional regulator [Halococcoides cellulosivorans]